MSSLRAAGGTDRSLDRFVDGFAARMAREAKPTCGTTWRSEIAVLELLRGVDGVVELKKHAN